jgi:Zn-dependent protease/CBS domain-containing protein
MQAGWRVGSIFGIPFYIDPSWFVIVVWIAISRSPSLQASGLAPVPAYIFGVLIALLLFGSVLLHELGHSLVAISQGIKVNSITLFLLGGVASIEQESKTPGKAFQVAIAGPLVSLGLFILLVLVAQQLPDKTAVAQLVQQLALINLALGLLNLLPGLPLDGGQVLKAAVWKLTGDRLKGVRWAARTGSILGWIGISLGIWAFLIGAPGGLWLALIGWFILQNATSYDRMTTVQQALLALNARDAMTREFRVVDASLTLRQFADDYLLAPSRAPVYFAASDGRYRGLVVTDDLHTIERSEWERENLYRIIQPLTDIPTVQEADSLVNVIQKMEDRKLPRVTVISPAGAVAGVIDRGDIVRVLAQRLNMPVSEAMIQQIKEEGSYPNGFQLGVIAQSVAESIKPSAR